MIKPVSCSHIGHDVKNKPVWLVFTDDGKNLSWVEGEDYVLLAQSELRDGKYRHFRVPTKDSKLVTVVKFAVKKEKERMANETNN